jgi:hypothetical protein
VVVFLTLVGGGAFGNRSMWITRALARALHLYRHWPLDVKLVHYQRLPPKGELSQLEAKYGKSKGKSKGKGKRKEKGSK